jgi:hypothetical protein
VYVFENGFQNDMKRLKEGLFTKKECKVLRMPPIPNEKINYYKRNLASQNKEPLYKRKIDIPIFHYNDYPKEYLTKELANFMGSQIQSTEKEAAYLYTKNGGLVRLFDRTNHPNFLLKRYKKVIELPLTFLLKEEMERLGLKTKKIESPVAMLETNSGHLKAIYDKTDDLKKIPIIPSQDVPAGYLSQGWINHLQSKPVDPSEIPYCIAFDKGLNRRYEFRYDRRNDQRWRLKIVTESNYDPINDPDILKGP